MDKEVEEKEEYLTITWQKQSAHLFAVNFYTRL